jgi:uncharacterized protein YciI
MHWLIKCRSRPDTDALRLATIDAHRKFLDGYSGVTWYSGPVFTDDNKNAIGSLRLIEFPGRDAALAYINADPYTKAGIFQAITVERWKPALDVRQRDYPRREGTMQFVIHCHDKPDGGARRAPLEDAHFEYMKAHRKNIVARGALLDDDGGRSIGAVLILDVADKSAAEAFWAGAPFNRGGIYEWTTIERWRFGHV